MTLAPLCRSALLRSLVCWEFAAELPCLSRLTRDALGVSPLESAVSSSVTQGPGGRLCRKTRSRIDFRVVRWFLRILFK